ncbi:MAG: hypothetical protein H0W55_12360 [Actinobacteria bacterium]|nr:hypothetical protein [Actinomycetota bacterium]
MGEATVRATKTVLVALVMAAVGFTSGSWLTSASGTGGPGVGTAGRAAGIGDVSSYPKIRGGVWSRGPNLTDARGNFQARQEHGAVVLNGFVYLIGGFVPQEPPPQPTENDPEPFPFEGTGEILVYTPVGHPTAPADEEGEWQSLPQTSSFPVSDMHHIIAVRHKGKIWAFGGHAGPFEPTRKVFAFTPTSSDAPEGTWRRVRMSDGRRCAPSTDTCLRLPRPRAAGAAVSIGNRIFLMGGVVPFRNSPDPVNASIRTTRSVISLNTAKFPLEWKEQTSLRRPREHFNAVVAKQRIWAFHGRNEASTHMRKVESWVPGSDRWRREQLAPVGTSANILARVGKCVYSFGGEFIASNVTGTLIASQVFHLPSRSWHFLESTVETEPLDASGATSKHGTYGVRFRESATTKIMAPGGAATAWFDPTSKVHVFDPPAGCES